jgi:hypothetical protein
MDPNALFGVAAVVAALGVTSSQIITAFTARHVARKVDGIATTVDAVHHEVKTLNGSTIAELAEATEERRVENGH